MFEFGLKSPDVPVPYNLVKLTHLYKKAITDPFYLMNWSILDLVMSIDQLLVCMCFFLFLASFIASVQKQLCAHAHIRQVSYEITYKIIHDA